MQGLLEHEGRLRGDRRIVPEPHPGALSLAYRRQESAVPDTASIFEEERPLPQRAHRGRRVPGGHRPVLSAGRRGRGYAVRRNAAEDGKRRPHDQRPEGGRPMKAVVYDRYGPPDVLRFDEVDRPVPKEDEVLIKVHATTVNRSDVHTREANRTSGLTASLV